VCSQISRAPVSRLVRHVLLIVRHAEQVLLPSSLYDRLMNETAGETSCRLLSSVPGGPRLTDRHFRDTLKVMKQCVYSSVYVVTPSETRNNTEQSGSTVT